MAVDIKLKRSHTHSNIPTTSDLSEGEFAVNTYDGKMYMRDGSSNIVTVGSHYTTDFEPSTKTFYVTVATSTSSHVHHGSGSSNKYKINGVFSPFLRLIPGITYRFDQSDSSNSGHPFRFYLDENKSTSYTTGVTTNGTAGSAGAYTEIVVSHSTPAVLHYQCSAHSLMGWAAFVNTHNLTAFDTGDLTEGSNLYFTNARADARVNLQTGANLDLSSKDTDDLSEGSTNLYFTNTRADARVSAVLPNTDSLSEGSTNLYYTDARADARVNAGFSAKDTDDLSEGSTNLYYTDARVQAVSINNVVEDTTPQLGGNLDLNSNNITGTGDISVTGDITITSTDAGSTNGPTLDLYRNSASPASGDYLGQIAYSGENSNGGVEIYAKVTGKITDPTLNSEDGLIETAIKGGGSFTIVSRQRSDELQLLNGVGLSVAGNTTLSGTLGVTGNTTLTGTLSASGIAYPSSDGNSGQVITTDGSGNLSFASVGSLAGSGIQNVSDDTSPQLGGDLDVVTHSIISSSNRDINITPNGTGKVVIGTNGLEFGDGTVQTTAGGAGGSGESVSWSVTQSSHGLAVGDIIYNNGTNYVKAQADDTATLGLFVVSAVADVNTFTATFSGKITLSSLTAGEYYFVSNSTAGAYVATEPTSGYSNPILFALSTTEAVVLPYRPSGLSSDAAAGRTALDVYSTSETNQQVSAFAIALG